MAAPRRHLPGRHRPVEQRVEAEVVDARLHAGRLAQVRRRPRVDVGRQPRQAGPRRVVDRRITADEVGQPRVERRAPGRSGQLRPGRPPRTAAAPPAPAAEVPAGAARAAGPPPAGPGRPATSHGPIARSVHRAPLSVCCSAPGTGGSTAGGAIAFDRLSARRPASGPYSPGGCTAETGVVTNAVPSSPARGGRRRGPARRTRPTSPPGSAARHPGRQTRRRTTPPAAAACPGTAPDNGRLDQSAFAVTWNSTTRPAPREASVTSGVPSASRAQVWSASVAVGSASTCRLTVTSAGTGQAGERGQRREGGQLGRLAPGQRAARVDGPPRAAAPASAGPP